MTLYTKNPVTNYGIPLCMSLNDVFSAENYKMFRVILIEAGTGIIKINKRSFVFMSPSLFCLNEKDAMELEKECGVKAQVIYFDPAVINSSFTVENIYSMDIFDKFTNIQDYFYMEPFLNRRKKQSQYFELGLATFKRISQLFKMLYEEINPCDGDYWICRSRTYFLEILFLIQALYTSLEEDNTIKLPNTSDDLNEIILYLHTNYQNKITIEDLTKIFHINRTTLSEKFRASTGLTIKDYLIKLRIKLAAVMLRDTLLPISEIMYRVGFIEANHFSRIFKKHMNFSPSEYRKEHYK